MQWCEEKISTLKTDPESKPEFDLTKNKLVELIKRHLGKVKFFWGIFLQIVAFSEYVNFIKLPSIS